MACRPCIEERCLLCLAYCRTTDTEPVVSLVRDEVIGVLRERERSESIVARESLSLP